MVIENIFEISSTSYQQKHERLLILVSSKHKLSCLSALLLMFSLLLWRSFFFEDFPWSSFLWNWIYIHWLIRSHIRTLHPLTNVQFGALLLLLLFLFTSLTTSSFRPSLLSIYTLNLCLIIIEAKRKPNKS